MRRRRRAPWPPLPPPPPLLFFFFISLLAVAGSVRGWGWGMPAGKAPPSPSPLPETPWQNASSPEALAAEGVLRVGHVYQARMGGRGDQSGPRPALPHARGRPGASAELMFLTNDY